MFSAVFRRKEIVMSIPEFIQMQRNKTNLERLKVNFDALSMLIPPVSNMPDAPASQLAEVASQKVFEKVVHSFDPLVIMIQALAYPVALVMVLGGCLCIMIGNKEKGFSMIQLAGIGYILVQLAPTLLNVLVDISKNL